MENKRGEKERIWIKYRVVEPDPDLTGPEIVSLRGSGSENM
jgi:hypothetical protein